MPPDTNMMYTHTKTGNETTFADPYKKCCECGQFITGTLEIEGEPLILMPCEHQASYFDVCPSWGPVDGCTCEGQDPHGFRAAQGRGSKP